jgi:uncharacterized DUF497 family protein
MRITFDQSKRDATYDERGLAFEDAAVGFEGVTLDVVDDRFDCGERGDARHIISMRKANEREKRRFAQRLGTG